MQKARNPLSKRGYMYTSVHTSIKKRQQIAKMQKREKGLTQIWPALSKGTEQWIASSNGSLDEIFQVIISNVKIVVPCKIIHQKHASWPTMVGGFPKHKTQNTERKQQQLQAEAPHGLLPALPLEHQHLSLKPLCLRHMLHYLVRGTPNCNCGHQTVHQSRALVGASVGRGLC